MNWIKQNQMLAGFLGFVLVAAGVLGFLAFLAKGNADAAKAEFDQQAAELKRLEGLQPYPSDKNLKTLQNQKKQQRAQIEELNKALMANELPVETSVSPAQFQDQLRAAVQEFTDKAGKVGLALPADKTFFMGFDRYQSELPRPEAAPLLARQLRAVQIVMNLLLDHRVREIRSLERVELPEETGVRPEAEAAASKSRSRTGAKSGGEDESKLLRKEPFTLVIFSDQISSQAVLNGIVNSKAQFFIPRVITVRNEKETGPQRVDPNAVTAPGIEPAPAFAPPPADPSAPPAAGAPAAAPAPVRRFVVGEERIETTLRLELIDFDNLPPTK